MASAELQSPQSFEELEKLVQQLYQPGSSQDITRIQDQLQKWQRSEAGWEMADRLLGSTDPNVRFFGALTLTVKLNLDWDKLDTEKGPSSQVVLSGLVTTIIHSVNRNEAQFVLRKLCSSLVTYFSRPISDWAFPVKQLICSFHEGQYVHEDVLQSVSLTPQIIHRLNPLQLLTVLWFATDLAEEVMKMDSPEQRRYHELMPSNLPDVQSLLQFTLEHGTSGAPVGVPIDPNSPPGLSEADSKIRQTALACFSSWTNYCSREWINATEQLSVIISLIPHALMNVYLGVEDAETVFIDLLQDCRNILDSKLAQHSKILLYDLVLSDWSKSRLAGLGDADPSSISFARFILAFAELEVDPLRLESTAARSKALLEIIHHLSRFSPEDDEDDAVSIYALEFWSSYVESIADDLIASGPETPGWVEYAQSEVNQAIPELLAKIVSPPPNITSSWDSDQKRAFQSFRQDFGDLLESAYIFLGEGLTRTLVDATQQHLSTQDWWRLEAFIYCLNKLADTICERAEEEDTSEDALLHALFRSSLFTELSSNPKVPRRLLKTSVDMLACYSQLFRKHIELLPSALNFLFSSLQVPHLASDSARSISTLCSSCRQSLISELPAFLQQYESFRATPTADVYTKEKVTGGISAIIQAVGSTEEQVTYLASLLSFIEQDVRQMVELVANQDIEQGLIMAQSAMECLASMGKGLQSPDDALISAVPTTVAEATIAAWQPIQQRIIRCVEMTTQVLAEDSDLMEQACNVLRAGYKEKLYGAFVLPARATVDFVTRAHLRTARLPVILATAQTFIKHHIDRLKPSFGEDARLLLHHLLSLIRELGDPSQDPEVSQSLIELLGAYTQDHMVVLRAELGADLEHAFHFTLAALRGQDILPKRATTSFWANLLTVCASGRPDDQVLAKEILQYFVTGLCDALVFQISGDAPHSALEYIVIPLTKLIATQRNVRQMINQSLSKRYNNDPISGARARFLQAIMSAKGFTARKVISDFWQACRRHAVSAPMVSTEGGSGLTGSALNPQVID